MSEWKTETCEACEYCIPQGLSPTVSHTCRAFPPQGAEGYVLLQWASEDFPPACSQWRRAEPPATNIADLKDE